MKSVYIETTIISYLTARPTRDLRAAAWQQTTAQWWETERRNYDLVTSELVLVEAESGNVEAAERRMRALDGILVQAVGDDARALASRLVAEPGIPGADALHIALACVHGVDYLLTWNCRHIDNAATKPMVRSTCAVAGYVCPEICTPMELMSEESEDATG